MYDSVDDMWWLNFVRITIEILKIENRTSPPPWILASFSRLHTPHVVVAHQTRDIRFDAEKFDSIIFFSLFLRRSVQSICSSSIKMSIASEYKWRPKTVSNTFSLNVSSMWPIPCPIDQMQFSHVAVFFLSFCRLCCCSCCCWCFWSTKSKLIYLFMQRMFHSHFVAILCVTICSSSRYNISTKSRFWLTSAYFFCSSSSLRPYRVRCILIHVNLIPTTHDKTYKKNGEKNRLVVDTFLQTSTSSTKYVFTSWNEKNDHHNDPDEHGLGHGKPMKIDAPFLPHRMPPFYTFTPSHTHRNLW